MVCIWRDLKAYPIPWTETPSPWADCSSLAWKASSKQQRGEKRKKQVWKDQTHFQVIFAVFFSKWKVTEIYIFVFKFCRIMWFPAGFSENLLVQRTAKEVLLRRHSERHTSWVQMLQKKLLRKVIWRVVQCVFTLMADGACLYLLTHLRWGGWVDLCSGAGMSLEFSPNTKADKASYQQDLWV